MKIPSFVFLLLLAMLSFLAGCSGSVDSDGDDQSSNKLPVVTPEQVSESNSYNNEAGHMALWYGDDLLAEGTVYARFWNNLTLLRDTYRDSIPQVEIMFVFPVVVNQILVGLSDSAANEFRNGTYTAWDSLNTLFRVKDIDTSVYFDIHHSVKLTFDGLLNPKYLALYYEPLAGVIYAEPNGLAGDWSNIYPWMVDNRVTFLIREAWGDCPSGCIYSHFFYFRETDTGIEYVGDWPTNEPKPEWFDEAGVAFCRYIYGLDDCP